MAALSAVLLFVPRVPSVAAGAALLVFVAARQWRARAF
jgi:hypothetical protein